MDKIKESDNKAIINLFQFISVLLTIYAYYLIFQLSVSIFLFFIGILLFNLLIKFMSNTI